MKQKRSGFTLIEMLVTVALLGLITALSITALGSLQARYTRRQAADLVASAAARAQLSARETGRCHSLEVYTSDTTAASIGVAGDRLRLARRTTADCESSNPSELETVEWVRMPGKSKVVVPSTPTSKTRPEWRPNSRLRQGETELWVIPPSGPPLAIRMMGQGPVCVSDLSATFVPVEACP
jgi:prepilin-type N-terminal cleavage/methylation domain-containing protein